MRNWIQFLIIVIATFFVQISPPGPDAKLYFGLGSNLVNGVGFIDNIRNDEILPSIGYPLVIMFALRHAITGELFTITFLIVSLLLLFEGLKNLNIHYVISLIIIFLFISTLPTLNVWGIEVMLIFSTILLFYSATSLLKSQAFITMIFFAVALFIVILVRPILMPLLYLMFPLILYYVFMKDNLRKTIVTTMILFISSLIAISALSYSSHGDKRYLTGTYSAIPLYCAWNKYIDLESIYYSSGWRKVADDLKTEALAPLKNINGWQERDSLLKAKVLEFIYEQPRTAIKGYLWRISKFTYAADIASYRLLFYIWIFLLIINFIYLKRQTIKDKIFFLFSLILPVYIILITSVFIYSGSRYLVTPTLYMIFSIAFLIYLLKEIPRKSQKKSKNILFISANDFKEKSIQVIRKTPEAYVKDGWDVVYLVARDNSKTGNYFYEKEINPEGVNVIRFEMPLTKVKDYFRNHTVKTIFSKIIGFVTIFLMFIKAVKLIKKYNISILYGYEIHGVLAASLCKIIYGDKLIYVHRFMGTWLTSYYKQKKRLKLFLNLDAILALKLNSDLLIMTNDGTQGIEALKKVESKSLKNYRFWTNGVDEQKISNECIYKFKKSLGLKNEKIFLSISRLESWKRVDRVINAIELMKEENFKYFIIGDGYLRGDLEKLVKEKKLEDKVVFVGGISNSEVKRYLNIADIFLSLYDLSNVGNPLLEAIRANKIIFTLNNGDTKEWIKHKTNGFIYDIDDKLYENIVQDIEELFLNSDLKDKILFNIKNTEAEKLWTWDKRMKAEVLEVEKLLNDK